MLRFILQTELSKTHQVINNVGIGIIPSGKLHVSSQFNLSTSSGAGAQGIFGYDNKRLLLGYDNTNDFAFLETVENGQTWGKNLVINSRGGNVGIGTNPNSINKLHVLGRLVTENEGIYAIGDLGSLILASHSSYYSKPSIYSLTPSGSVSDLLINPAGGNVGIGTSPNSLNKLHVLGRFVTENDGMYAIGDVGSLIMASHTSYYSKPSIYSLAPCGSVSDLLINPAGGNVGIGTSNPAFKLDVLGIIRAQEIKVDLNGADFVFEDDFQLRKLEDVEAFIKENKHLPEIEPAAEMEASGTDLGELNSKLLQKIEELTLYTIQQQKEIEQLQEQNREIEALKEKMTRLEALLK